MPEPTSPKDSRQRAQALIEYALIIAMVSMAVVAILALVGPAVSNVFSNVVEQINYGGSAVGWRGGESSSYVGPAGVSAVCGDGLCDWRSENHDNCPADCSDPGGSAACGDGRCEPSRGENSITCPADCGGTGFGTCGDGICTSSIGETVDTCPQDCSGTAPTQTPGGPTPIPDCNDLAIGAVRVDSSTSRVSLTNGFAQPITISRVVAAWAENSTRVLDYMWLGSSSNGIWGRNYDAPRDTTSPTDTGGEDAAGWLLTGGSPTILPGITVDLTSIFRNGPSITSGEHSSFSYTVTFTNGCVLSNELAAPATMTPNPSGTPDCSPFAISAVTFGANDEVRTTITNNSSQAVAIVGLIFQWPKLNTNMVNDWIQLERPDGSTNNYIWSGVEGVKDDTPPTDSMVADVSQWLAGGGSPTIAAGASQTLFNEFDNAPDIRFNSYPNQYSYRVFLSNGCELETDTPLPAYTYITLEETDFTVSAGSYNHTTDMGASRCYMYRTDTSNYGNPASSPDVLTYDFNITDPGTYVIYAHTKGNLANSSSPTSYDSFYLQIDDGSPHSPSTPYGYVNFNDLPLEWTWARVTHYVSSGNNVPMFFELDAGPHTLRIREREANTAIDAFVITNDLAYVPPPTSCTAANPPILEAEHANIEGTMMQVGYDDTYSGCSYVASIDQRGEYDGQGWIEFEFDAPITGDYVVWARALGTDSSGDSFYVSLDRGYEYNFSLFQRLPDTPRWYRVRHSNAEDDTYSSMNPVVFNMNAGRHTLRFRTREDGSMLDAIVVALNGGYTPSEEVYCSDVMTPTPQPMLTCGSTTLGNITNQDWADEWQFIGTEDTLVTFTMRRTSGDLDSWLDLYDPTDGSIMISDDNHGAIPDDSSTSRDAQLAYVLPANGLYTLRATRYRQASGSSVGGYNLEMQCRPLTAQPITCGDQFEDSLEEEDWLDLWSFAGQEGAQVTIRMDRSSGSSLRPALILVAPDGAVVAEHNPNSYYALLNNVTLPQSGIYTVWATRYGQAAGSTTGGYRLGLACQNTASLICGKTQSGRITNTDYYDYWEFTANAGDYISITMYPDPSTPALDPYLELYRSSDLTSYLVYDDDEGDGIAAAIDYLIPESGSYTIRARRYGSSGGASGSTEGEYQITLTCHQPEPISCGDIVTGSLDNTDYYDVYTITIPGGVSAPAIDIGQFALSGTLLTGNGVRTTLYQNALPPSDNSDGTNRVAYGDNVSADWLYRNLTVSTGTTYYIRAGRQGEGDRSSDTAMTGDYRLSLRCNWHILPENTVACDTPVHGEITDHAWYEYYTFNATAGQLLNMTMYKDDAALNPYLYLYGPDGNQVSPTDWGRDDDHGADNNAALRQYLVPTSGTYTIRATRSGYDPANMSLPEGRYTLNVACNSPIPISCNDTVTGAITNQDFIDRYVFNGVNGGNVQIAMTTMTGNLDSKLYLLRPGYEHNNYNILAHQPQTGSDGTLNATLNATLDQSSTGWEIWASRYSPTGTYDPSDSDTEGTYRLTVMCDWAWTPEMCAANFSIGSLEFNPIDPGHSVRALVANTGVFDAVVDRVQFYWPMLSPGIQYNDYLRFRLGQDIWGADNSGASADTTSPTDTQTDSPYMTTNTDARRLPAGESIYVFNEFEGITDIRSGSNISNYRYVVTLSNGCILDTSATPATCGNAVCDTGEDVLNCPGDCPSTCGDTFCLESAGENAQTCPTDCPARCGDGLCTGGESAYTCGADCADTYTSISCGAVSGSTTGSISNVEWYDWYRFNGTAGQTVTITLTATSGTLDPYLRLYNDSGGAPGSMIAENDDIGGDPYSRNSRLVVTLPSTGAYYIQATRWEFNTTNRGGEGNYELTFECARCGDAWCNGTENQVTCPGDCPTVCGDGACSPGETLGSCPQDCAVCGDGLCTAGGGETVYTCPQWGPPINGDCQPSATTVTCGSATSGDITSAEWYDLYSFSAVAGQQVAITMARTSGDLNPYLQLFNASGTLLTYDDDSAGDRNAYISDFTLSAPGAYYIRAGRWNYQNGTTTGNYSLTLNCSAPFDLRIDAASSTGYTSPVTGYVWQPSAGFSGASSRTVTNSVSGTQEDLLYQTYLYGDPINWSWSVPNGTYTVTLYFAEFYYSSSNQRVFDVFIEGTRVRAGLDIYAQVGRYAALVLPFYDVTVTDGTLNITFDASRGSAVISAIEVTNH
ncbi:MAG: pre-peptidase C-terminal domain-containing protein [Anaerolineae bacterium]|nr:pre-peptidase C-terminal domain-containing protein [Anaerolineae bacterium]